VTGSIEVAVLIGPDVTYAAIVVVVSLRPVHESGVYVVYVICIHFMPTLELFLYYCDFWLIISIKGAAEL
jgi:hypothetical protein